MRKLDQFSEVRVVLGNEASDLDSMVSSALYAFYIYKVSSKKMAVGISGNKKPLATVDLPWNSPIAGQGNGIVLENLAVHGESLRALKRALKIYPIHWQVLHLCPRGMV